MMTPNRPILFDVTRLIATGWMRQNATGIDRVCDAYLRHYQKHAHAVIQHKGVFRVLSERHSDKLFALLANRGKGIRYQLTNLLARMIAASSSTAKGDGRVYINVGHTDFDLKSHERWISRCNLKPVYMIHDMIPIDDHAYCLPHATKRHRGRVISALKIGAGIIVNSRSTASDLCNFAVDQEIPIPPLLAAHLGAKTFDDDRAKTPEVSSTHFVCIGTIEPRKNHLMLLKVWQQLVATRSKNIPQLIIIGRWGKKSESVRKLFDSDPKLTKHVTFLDKCNDEELLQWTKSSKAVLLPSLAEGFGLPLVEAMVIGAPVIASNLACFKEIGGNIPLFLSPNDPLAWQSTIEEFLDDDKERNRQKRLLSHFVAPSWDNHFATVDSWLNTINDDNMTKQTDHSSRIIYTKKSINLSPSEISAAESLTARKIPSL